MNSCPAGGIALSSNVIRSQLGMVFQAGGPDGWTIAVTANGRCVAAMMLVLILGTSAANTRWKSSGLMVSSTSMPPGAAAFGTGRAIVVSGVISAPGNCTGSGVVARLSPSSSTKAPTNTNALTFGTPRAALEITAPPYE